MRARTQGAWCAAMCSGVVQWCTGSRANSRGKWTLIEFSAIAAVSADGDDSDDAMVLRTPKALPNRRCGGEYDLGTCAHRLGHRRESVDRAQERAPHLLG